MAPTGGGTCSIHQLTFSNTKCFPHIGSTRTLSGQGGALSGRCCDWRESDVCRWNQDNVVTSLLYTRIRIEGAAAHCAGGPRKAQDS